MSEIVQTESAPLTSVLPARLQAVAIAYVAARRRAEEALLDAARCLWEARNLCGQGAWGQFLEATGTSEGTAKRLLDIHAAAQRSPAFAEAIRAGRLGATVAGELAQPSTPRQVLETLLAQDVPPTLADVKTAKTEAKSAILAEVAEGTNPTPPALPPDLAAAGWSVDSLPDGTFAGLQEGRATQGYATMPALIAALRATSEAPEPAPAPPSLDSLLYRLSKHGWDRVRSFTRGKGGWVYHEFKDAGGPDRDVTREVAEGALAMWADELDAAAAAKAERKRRDDLAVSACSMNIQQMRDHPEQMEYYRTYARHRAAEASDPLLTQRLNAEIAAAEKAIKAAREEAQPAPTPAPARRRNLLPPLPPPGWEWEPDERAGTWRLLRRDALGQVCWHTDWYALGEDAITEAATYDGQRVAKTAIAAYEEQHAGAGEEEEEAYSDRIEAVISLCQEITERVYCGDRAPAIAAWIALGRTLGADEDALAAAEIAAEGVEAHA